MTITTANVTDRAGALETFKENKATLWKVESVWVDSGYTGQPFANAVNEILAVRVQVATNGEFTLSQGLSNPRRRPAFRPEQNRFNAVTFPNIPRFFMAEFQGCFLLFSQVEFWHLWMHVKKAFKDQAFSMVMGIKPEL